MMAMAAATTSETQSAIQYAALTECGERLPDMGKLGCIFMDYDFDELDQETKIRGLQIVT